MTLSIFDKSHDTEGLYLLHTKQGVRIAYTKRSAIWKDKAGAQFVTLDLYDEDYELQNLEDYLDNNDYIYNSGHPTFNNVDVRYNDVSLILEIKKIIP